MAGGAVVMYSDVTPVTCAARCALTYPCSSFTYSVTERVCALCALCGNFSMVHAPGYQLFVSTEDPVDPSYNQTVGRCATNATTAPRCWRPPAKFKSRWALTSVGPAGVWAVDKYGQVFLRSPTLQNPFHFGRAWKLVMRKISQLDVGKDSVWAITRPARYLLQKKISGTKLGKEWRSPKRGKWISISPGGSLWAVNLKDQLLHFQNSSWVEMASNASRVDAGLAGVWMLNSTGHILYRQGTYGDNASAGTDWETLQGATYQSVSSGRDLVVAVDKGGMVWLRTAVGPDTPTGLAWLRYPGYLRQVHIYQGGGGTVFWGTDSEGNIYFSRLN
ncbi:hypothetical protein ACOMHN_045328 [Nucella lapillus]